MATVRCPTCGTEERVDDPEVSRIVCIECRELVAVPRPVGATARCPTCGTSEEITDPRVRQIQCARCGDVVTVTGRDVGGVRVGGDDGEPAYAGRVVPRRHNHKRAGFPWPSRTSLLGALFAAVAEEVRRMDGRTRVQVLAIVAVTFVFFGLAVSRAGRRDDTPAPARPVGAAERPKAESERSTTRPSPARTPPEPTQPAKRSAGTGDIASVVCDGESEVFAAVDDHAHGLLLKYARAKDPEGTARLLLTGQVLVVPVGTRVRVIGTRLLTREVRILEGTHAGKEAILPFEFVE